jgi:elongation factor G
MESTSLHPKARTVALIGRTGSGKTTLLDALAVAGATLERPGRVEEGTTLGGNDPEERRHVTSLKIALAPARVGDDELILLDTPGLVDFHGEVERALDVADVALLVVSAVDGVQPDTAVLWDLAHAAGVPVAVFVNAMDAERASFESTLSSLESLVGPSLAPLEIPMGSGPEFSGVVDLLADEALVHSPGGSRHEPVPSELAELEQRVRASLLEAIVVGDDALTERYLDGDLPSIDELESVLGHLMSEGRIVPLILGSATGGVGVDRLLTLLDEIAESRPIPALERGEPVLLERDPRGDLVLRAFKVIVDPYVGRIVVFEVVSGTLSGDVTLVNCRTRAEERLHSLNHVVGTKLVPVNTAHTGDVIAIAKLASVQVGDYLAPRGRDLAARPTPPLVPALSVAITASDADMEKVAAGLHRLAEEDASLKVRADALSRRLVADTAGELHLQVTLERLARRFNVKASTEPPVTPLFETIVGSCEVEGRLKKQTGGHGQFAVVNLRVEPIDSSSTLEFVDAVVGGAVPRQYIDAVRHGVEKAMAHGGPAGHPVVGLRVTLYDGKAHSVDSSEQAFETAGSIGLRSALDQRGTSVLERIMAVEITVPATSLGEVMTDLSGRRGRVIGTDQDDEGRTIVRAQVPEAELTRYGLELRTLSAGRGRARVEPSHLAPAPASVLSR